MLVTVWRHGEAGVAPRDEDRELTLRGISSLEAAVAAFDQWRGDQLLPPVSACRYSPLVRTRQTASILSTALGLTAEACPALAPGADLLAPEGFLDEAESHLILVSHQPFVSELIAYWLDDGRVAPLYPGGWAALELLAPVRGGATLHGMRASVYP